MDFAPVALGAELDLIDLMEGVEDIPGTALHEGMPWVHGTLNPNISIFSLAGREYAINISSLVARGAVSAARQTRLRVNVTFNRY